MNRAVIQAEYVTGAESISTLAAKHQIPRSSLYEQAKRESWGQKRSEYRQQMAQELVRQCRSSRMSCAQVLQQTTDSLTNWLAEVVQQLRQGYENDGKADLRQLRDAVAAVRELRALTEADGAAQTVRVVFDGDSRDCCG